MITVATFVDRMGRVYGNLVEPDQLVAGDLQAIEASAAAWIHGTTKG